MITYIDLPQPEETFAHACARLTDDLLFPSKDAAMEYLFGVKHVHVAVDLPGSLNAFTDALPPGHSLRIDRVIDEHTALPFYSPFLPRARVVRMRDSMASGSGSGLHASAGIVATKIPAPLYLRYCPVCVEADRQRIGFCYWRRVHQLPGVHVCPDHAVWLEASALPVWGRSYRQSLITAERVVELRAPRLLDTTNTEHQIHRMIARGAAFLLTHIQESSPEDIRHRYVQILIKHDFATQRGTVRITKLLEAFQQNYPPTLLAGWGLSVNPANTKNWLARLCRSPQQAEHPICHLLLMHFLEISPEDFFAMTNNIAPFGEPPWPCLNPVCRHYRSLSITACRVEYRVDNEGNPTGIFACECGYVYTRTGPDKTAEDRWRKTRIEAYGPVWEARLRCVWHDSYETLVDIAHEFATDTATIKRNAARLGLSFERAQGTLVPLATLPPPGPTSGTRPNRELLAAHKETWLAAIGKNPNAGVQALRTIFPGAYAALYRHDPAWLREVTSRKKVNLTGLKCGGKHVNWEKRDRVFAKLVQRAAKRMIRQPGPPTHISRYRIAGVLKIRGHLQNQLHRLPQTAQAIAEIVESSQQLAVRRIQYRAAQARDQGLTITRAKLLNWACAWRYKDDPAVQQAIAAVLANVDGL